MVFFGRRSGEEVLVSTVNRSWEHDLTLMDVGKNAALGDSDVSEKLVKLLVVTDGKLEMTWNDTSFLVIASCISCQLQDFGS